MSRPAPLEVHVSQLDAGEHHYANLWDPSTGKVLMSAQEYGHDAALDRLLAHKAHSRYARRRYVVKSNRPPVVMRLLHLIDFCECTEDAETGADSTFLQMPVEEFIRDIRKAIAAIEGGAA